MINSTQPPEPAAAHRPMIGHLARLLDWFDDRVWGHRTYWLCVWICDHYPDK